MRGDPAIKMEKLMRESFIRNLTYCILIVLLLTGFGLAANTLEIKCVDENGQSVVKAKVIAVALKNNKFNSKKTGKDGIAIFKKMKDDYYRVWIEAKGFKKELREFIPLLNDNTEEKIEFVLQPGNEKDPLYFEDKLVMERADTLYKAGDEALQQNNLAEAEKRLTESIKIYPTQIGANNALAVIYFGTGRIEEAKACYERLINIAETFRYIEVDPNNIALYDKQIQQFQQILDNLPLHTLAAEVDKAMKAEDFETAVKKLDELIAMHPEKVDAFIFQKAFALNRLNKLDEAQKAIDEAIKLNPSENAYKNLQSNIEQKKRALALNESMQDLIKVDELNASGKYEEALASLAKLESATPVEMKGAFLWIKGRAHRGLDQKDEMIQSYEQALQNEKDSNKQGIYLNELINWLLDKNYLDELLAVYPRVAPAASVNVANGLFDIANRLKSKGDQDGAKSVFEKIVEIAPDSPESADAYYELGVICFYEPDNKEKAKTFLEKYIEIGKNNDHLNSAKDFLALMASQK